MKWISIKDRLPDVKVEVLVTDGIGISIAEQWSTRSGWHVFCAICTEDATHFLDTGLEKITHWMPLPPLPGDDNDNS